MRKAPRILVLAAVLAGGAGAGGAFALGQGASVGGAAGTGTAGPGTIVTATSTAPTPTGPPRGTVAEQTHPSVQPRTGGLRTRFTVRLTLGDAAGHTGLLATAYRLAVAVPAEHLASRCAPRAPATIDSGLAHQVVRVALITPRAGWCPGRYRVTVYRQRGPYCPRPAPAQPPAPCPEFASQDVDVGSAYFIAAAKH